MHVDFLHFIISHNAERKNKPGAPPNLLFFNLEGHEIEVSVPFIDVLFVCSCLAWLTKLVSKSGFVIREECML